MEQTLGKRIVHHRKRMGMTQDQLAEQLGVTAQAVSKWEHDLSCPDISILPRLAAIFCISVDDLLGAPTGTDEPVHQAEVVAPEAEEPEEKWHFQYDVGRLGSIGFAAWLLLVGGLLLAGRLLHWQAGLWDLMWPSALLVFGLTGLLGRFSVVRLGIAAFGGWFLLENLGFAPFGVDKELLLPVCILLLGLGLLLDAVKKPRKPKIHFTKGGERKGEKRHSTSMELGNEEFSCECSFGDDAYLIELDRLARGSMEVSFGELTVDLSGCKELAPDCHISAECAFGQLNIRVPRRYRVILTNDNAFASTEIIGNPDPQPQGDINMESDASFGSIEILYI